MANEDLEQALDSLHQSLADTSLIDEQTAVKMRSLIDEIQQTLSRSAPAAESNTSGPTLTKRIQSMISDFEAQHPKLTLNLSLIAERLADMGI